MLEGKRMVRLAGQPPESEERKQRQQRRAAKRDSPPQGAEREPMGKSGGALVAKHQQHNHAEQVGGEARLPGEADGPEHLRRQ